MAPRKVTLDDLRTLGFEVGVAFTGDGFEGLRIDGFGVSVMVRSDDHDALASLADRKTQAERERQLEESPEETTARLAAADK